MRVSRTELLLTNNMPRASESSLSMTHTNIDTLSETSYYIHFDVHPKGACLSEEILEKWPLFDMLLIAYCRKY
jgi:hypothetical protein